jgi:hypothetical protein
LSHDVDKIRDRELFYVLAAINQIRRRAMHGEPGGVRLGLRRLGARARGAQAAGNGLQTILAIEARHGFDPRSSCCTTSAGGGADRATP